jgi:hypothetical protein
MLSKFNTIVCSCYCLLNPHFHTCNLKMFVIHVLLFSLLPSFICLVKINICERML